MARGWPIAGGWGRLRRRKWFPITARGQKSHCRTWQHKPGSFDGTLRLSRKLCLIAQQMECHLATVGRVAMLENINPLPGAQRQTAHTERNCDTGLRQRGPDMSGHVIRSFRGVAVAHAVAGET